MQTGPTSPVILTPGTSSELAIQGERSVLDSILLRLDQLTPVVYLTESGMLVERGVDLSQLMNNSNDEYQTTLIT